MLFTTPFSEKKWSVVGNKAKGRILKRVLQEKEARKIFSEKRIFLTPWYAHVRSGSRKVRMSKFEGWEGKKKNNFDDFGNCWRHLLFSWELRKSH